MGGVAKAEHDASCLVAKVVVLNCRFVALCGLTGFIMVCSQRRKVGPSGRGGEVWVSRELNRTPKSQVRDPSGRKFRLTH